MSHKYGRSRIPKNSAERFVSLDNGEKTTMPDPDSNFLYIGRLVGGTAFIVAKLLEELTPDNVTEAFGQFVVPYTRPAALVNVEGGLKTINPVINTVWSAKPRAIDVTLTPAGVSLKNYGTEYGVSIGMGGNLKPVIKEALSANQSLAHNVGQEFMHPGNLSVIQVYTTPNENEAVYAASLVNRYHLNVATLSTPIICGLPKTSVQQ
jgi:hypothetical protein